MKSKVLFLIILIALMIGQVSIVNAEPYNGIVPCGVEEGDACTICDLAEGMWRIIDTIVKKWIFPTAMIIIVVSGIMYIVSSGNPGMISKAKTALTGALIGFAITLLAFAMITFILNTLFVKKSSLEEQLTITESMWTTKFNCE